MHHTPAKALVKPKMRSNLRENLRADDLLAWYDFHARKMPWRVPPEARRNGVMPDAYRVWLSEIMLQQTTVAAVKSYFEYFIARWPTVGDLAAAEDAEVMGAWAGLGYYARARNLLKCARVVHVQYNGKFPNDRAELLKLPGIGPYTAAAISAIAFDLPETVVDGNVERVMARLFDVHIPLPDAKKELTQLAAQLTPKRRPGDYAQAVMDLGATICTPRNPACGICPWNASCKGRVNGTANQLPQKRPKLQKPTRYGIIYYVERCDGAVLLEKRPETGLLGGMLGFPGSPWQEIAKDAPPIHATWRALNNEVRHTFTHFHLRLAIRVAEVGQNAEPLVGSFVPKNAFSPSALPTVMRKVFNLVKSGDKLT